MIKMDFCEQGPKSNNEINNFDRIGDWRKFSKAMEVYLVNPQKKYGTQFKMNDLCHYTGLRVFVWNMLKYALRLWSGFGKETDFEKTAHYSQMAWTLSKNQSRVAPFFSEDCDGDYVVIRKEIEKEI